MKPKWEARLNHEHAIAPPELLMDGRVVAVMMWDCHEPTAAAEEAMVKAVERRCKYLADCANSLGCIEQ